MAETAAPPKHILINGKRIHFRWLQQIAWSAAGAVIGAYMVSALYYLITQVHWDLAGHVVYLKPGWDHLLSYRWWPDARHDVRDVYEGVFATLFIKSIITKRKYWGTRVSTWRLATSPLLVFLAAAPVVALGIWVVDIRNFSVPYSIHAYQAYLIGFVAAQVVHRLYAPVGNTVQEFFIEEMTARQWTPRFPLPPGIRERYAWEQRTPLNVTRDNGRIFPVLVCAMVAVLLFLAVYGAYVRLVVAHS